MKAVINFIGGLAGAAVLTLLHQAIRTVDVDAPRLDLVGEEGMNKLMESAGAEPLEGYALFAATLAGDLLSNAVYYSVIGTAKKYLLARGAAIGIAAGVGALALTKPIGLNDAPIARTRKTKIMTLGYYLVGGLVTAITIKALRRKVNKEF